MELHAIKYGESQTRVLSLQQHVGKSTCGNLCEN